MFGKSAGCEYTAVLKAVDEYHHYCEQADSQSAKNYLLNGFEVAYKSGNFYSVDEDSGVMMSIGVTYEWVCGYFLGLVGGFWEGHIVGRRMMRGFLMILNCRKMI